VRGALLLFWDLNHNSVRLPGVDLHKENACAPDDHRTLIRTIRIDDVGY
jgi:hypothetical protein